MSFSPGLSFLIRAKDEEENILLCLKSLEVLLDKDSRYELIIIDHNSKDKTWQLIQDFARQRNYRQLTIDRYLTPIAKVGPHYGQRVKADPLKSIANYYNWCLAKATKINVIKWDADFVAHLPNLTEMVEKNNLLTRVEPFALWFTGETMFEHLGQWYRKLNPYYDEYRCFFTPSIKWVDYPRCEGICYLNQVQRLTYNPPVFYEMKRTSIDEFESREGIVDKRDTEDSLILSDLIKGKQPLEGIEMTSDEFLNQS